MEILIIFASAILALSHTTAGQFCGPQFQDIPNPASDSCAAFFRCYQSRRYSLRCAAGQAFDFTEARCRPANLVDCPLQLQRFQAPGIPHYLRSNTVSSDPRVEVRVIQVGDSRNPNNLRFVDGNGQRVPVTRQLRNRPQGFNSQIQPQAGHSMIRSHPVNPFTSRSLHDSPVSGLNTPSQGQGLSPNQPAINFAANPSPNPNLALPIQ